MLCCLRRLGTEERDMRHLAGEMTHMAQCLPGEHGDPGNGQHPRKNSIFSAAGISAISVLGRQRDPWDPVAGRSTPVSEP